MPLTLRIIYHSVGAIYMGVIVFVVGWLWLVPANPEERVTLQAAPGQDKPAGLAYLRLARAAVHFAPNRAAMMLSEASGGEISPELASLMLNELATNGTGLAAPPPDPSDQTGTGAKFISVERQ